MNTFVRSQTPRMTTQAANQAALETAKREGHAAGFEVGKRMAYEENFKQSALAERKRLKAILMSPEAFDRAEMANYIAFKTELSAEDARATLAKTPKEKSVDALAVVMGTIKNPAVGVDFSGGGLSDDAAVEAIAGSIVALHVGGGGSSGPSRQ